MVVRPAHRFCLAHLSPQGFYGECGLRGGYFEVFNIPHDVKAELYKLCSISLCSNTVGQVRASQVLRGVFCAVGVRVISACYYCCTCGRECKHAVDGCVHPQCHSTEGKFTTYSRNNAVG
jgi:hypothetical protein